MVDMVEVRRLVAAATEMLIQAIDLVDGDPDLEDDDPDLEDDDPAGSDDAMEFTECPVHLPGGNGQVPSKAKNLKAEREARDREKQWRRENEIWQAAQSARVEAGLPLALWSEENAARAEAGLPLLSIMEMRR